MACWERTPLLLQLHKAARAKKADAGTNTQPTPTPKKKDADKVASALASVAGSCRDACTRAHDRVCEAVDAIDAPTATPASCADAMESLVLADATLVAVAAAAQQLRSTLDRAADALRERKGGVMATLRGKGGAAVIPQPLEHAQAACGMLLSAVQR